MLMSDPDTAEPSIGEEIKQIFDRKIHRELLLKAKNPDHYKQLKKEYRQHGKG